MSFNTRITGLGTSVPDKILTNNDLEKIVDTSDEWIRTRTGIEKRYIAEGDTKASDLVLYAEHLLRMLFSRQLLVQYKIK